MNIHDLIDEMSEVYREQCGHIKYLNDEYIKVIETIFEADQTNGENITLAEYNQMNSKFNRLKTEIDNHKAYCDGIAYAMEILVGAMEGEESEQHE